MAPDILLLTMIRFPKYLTYSEKFKDDKYEYRQVTLTEELYRKIPKGRLLSEAEWRSLGIKQSTGWVHFDIFAPEPHVLLFRKTKKDRIRSLRHV